MHPFLRTRLALHMFLTFAIIGAWQPVLSEYLKGLRFTDLQIGLIMGINGLACMISPLVAGQAVDRWFATERVLALANLGTGVFLLAASTQRGFFPISALMTGASLFFVTSIPLGTSLAFHHLTDGARQFPIIRAWGTIGWVAGAMALWQWLRLAPGRDLGDCLPTAAAFALLNALYSLTLPHTPARRDDKKELAVGQVLGMLRDPPFALFSGLMFLLALSAVFYFSRLAIFLPTVGVERKNLSAFISIGQWVEIPAMFALGLIYVRLGAKITLALGIAAWVLRFALFAQGSPLGFIVAAIALHGPCFAFGRIAATVYVDRVCPRDARASAQAFLSFIMDGAGQFLGANLAGAVSTWLGTDWRSYWLIAGAGSLLVLLVFLAGFRARDENPSQRHREEA